MKRTTFGIIIALVVIGGAIVGYRQVAQAFSCGKSTCGYFTSSGNGSAYYDVLPQPALKYVWNASEFINTMNNYLYSGNWQQKMGAAFLIDNMLRYKGKVGDNVGGGVSAGISYAQNSTNFNTWKTLVYTYAVNSCATNSESNCSGASFGINWQYVPTQVHFCSGRTDSGYDNNGWPNYTGVNDDILYHTPAYGTNACNYEYTNSMPEIHFYWPGGQFNIGKHCGNLQDTENPIPAPNKAPTGTISVVCTNAATGQQTATVTLSDPDGATNGYIKLGTWQSGTVGSPGPVNITLPAPPTTSPYSGQTVTLYVKDVGPLANQAYTAVATDTTQVPCATLGCGASSVDPARLDPYMPFSVTVNVANGVGQTPPGATMSLTITPPSGASYGYSGSKAASGSGYISSATFSGLGPTLKTGLYTLSWTLTGAGLTQTCPGSFAVVNLPYLNVYGGDVFTGVSPAYSAGSSSCAVNTNGGIFSWNNYTAGYSGAATQYAIEALDQIQEFATAMGSTNTSPTGLSFANYYSPADATKLNPGQGLFGGNTGALGIDCDFTSDLKTAPVNGDVTIAGHSVANGAQEVHYVVGHDVYITGNITYTGTGGWAGVSQIPYFKLVVAGGDIYINSSVTQLDGIYVAESSGGASRGRIYTCASAMRAPVSPAAAGYYSTCNNKLVINGAFVAKQVEFLRTNGTLGQAKVTDTLSANHSAEVFNYTPELWLPRGANIPNSGYTAITGLPPVL